MIAREKSRTKPRERALLLLASIVALSLWPATGSGESGEESPPPKPPAAKAPASQPRAETAAPPVLTPTPAPAPPAPMPASVAGKQALGPSIEGVYSVEGGTAEVRVKRIFGDFFHVTSSDGWEGVGILDGSTYRGVFRHRRSPAEPDGTMGEQTIDWSDPGNPGVRATYTQRRAGEFVQRWRRLTDSAQRAPVKPPQTPAQPPKIMVTPDHRPEFGEYVYVEELPEAVTKVAPIYPDEARKAGIDGVVLLQVLVIEDGSVADYRIVQSVPALDDAAVAAVRQWRFKPALSAGRPVAVWVATPVRFSLR